VAGVCGGSGGVCPKAVAAASTAVQDICLKYLRMIASSE
jgi:hypothetical protein